MCTHSKQTNIILVILFFISFQVFSLILFSTFDQTGLNATRSIGCYQNEYPCKNDDPFTEPKCILREKMCDQIPDCPFGDDENDSICEDLLGYKTEFVDTNKSTTPAYEFEKFLTISPIILNPPIELPSDIKLTLESNNETKPNVRQTKSCIQNHCNLTDPEKICCRHQNMSDLTNITFQPSVQLMNLDSNNISHLDKRAFQNLSQLAVFSATHNHLTELDKDFFSGATKLRRLFLSDNKLTTLPVEIFRNSPDIKFMVLRNNRLADLDLNIFAPLKNMFNLELSCNQLTLENQSFPFNDKLRFLYLSENQIERITDETFKNLPNITRIELQYNKIFRISSNAFTEKPNFRHFFLSFNRISEQTLSSRFLDPIATLETLDLGHNWFNYLAEDVFFNNTDIVSLNLEGLSIYNVSLKHFDLLINLKFAYFSHFRYCMYVPYVNSCQPSFDKVSSLRNLLALPLLKFLVWSVGLLIILLNFMVLFFRSFNKNRNEIYLITCVKLLAISDSLIGFYMLAIAYFDLKFGNIYHVFALDFVHSWQCTGLGAIAVFSKEFSLFVVLLMSFDRKRIVTFRNLRFDSTNYFIYVTIGFSISLFIALFPILFWSSSNKNNVYFAANLLCYPLHLAEPFLLGWQFNAAVNIFINLPIVTIIIYLYSHVYFIIRKSRKCSRPAINLNSSKNNPLNISQQPLNGSSNLVNYFDHTVKISPNSTLMAKTSPISNDSEDNALAIRLFFIVATDCICWLPTIFIKIAALLNLRIPAILNAWIIIVILPINCILNPIIYTIAAPRRLSNLSEAGCNWLKKRFMILFKIKPQERENLRRKSSDSGDYRTSSMLNEDTINSTQITMHCLERKSSNEPVKHDFPNYLDCNNNSENSMPISRWLVKSSVTNL